MRLLLAGRHPCFRTTIRAEDVERAHELVIDMSELRFISPLDLAGLTCLAHDAAASGRPVKLVLPKDPDVTSYVQRMNLVREVDGIAQIQGDLPEDEREEHGDVLLELTRIEHAGEAEALAQRIVPIARKHSDPRVAAAVFMGLGEFLDNACTHAESRVGVFVAAQAYTGQTSGRRGLELAVADAGIGVLEHLRRNPRYRRFSRDDTAIRYAVAPGVTGTDDRRGFGFSDVLRDIRRAGLGRLIIRSQNGVGRLTVRHQDERRQFALGRFPVPGTWVWLRVRVP